MPSNYRKIGLLVHTWDGNLGNAATQDAVIHNIRIRCPQAEICGFCLTPQDTEKNHGIVSYPIQRKTRSLSDGKTSTADRKGFKAKAKEKLSGQPIIYKLVSTIFAITLKIPKSFLSELRFLIGSFKILKTFDLLIVSGGGQLNDLWGGAWFFPYTLFKWVLLARLRRVKIFFLNVGAGPIDGLLSKFFIKYALVLANYCSLRDNESENLLKEIGFRGNIDVYPDSVYSLDVDKDQLPLDLKINRKIVGINPMPFADPRVWPKKNSEMYHVYIHNLVSFGSWLIEKDYSIAIFASSITLDPLAIEDFKEALKTCGVNINSGRVNVHPISNLNGMLSMISMMDFIVTSRLHPTIFSHLLNKPVLAIAHHGKVSALMNDLGHSEYCLNIEHFDLNSLKKKFQSLERNNAEVKATIFEKVSHRKKALAKQFDSLLF